MTILLRICMALLFCLSLPAGATPTLSSIAVNGATDVSDCAFNATHTRCSAPVVTYATTTTTGPTSFSTRTQDARGSASASAEIDPASYLPALHAEARVDPAYQSGGQYGGSARADANVWAVQGYRYTGDTPFLLTITATLDSVFSSPDTDSFGNHSGFALSLFDRTGFAFPDSPPTLLAPHPELCPILYTTYGGGNAACPGMPTVRAFAFQSLKDSGTIQQTISYLLEPGKEFYVGAFLDANACCGISVDSSHTLRLAFNDASLLESLPVARDAAVPEPGALALFALASGALAAARRRRKA